MISRIALLAQGRTYAWRGQRNATWPVSSSLYRQLSEGGNNVTELTVRDREKDTLVRARRWGLGRDLGSSATDLHLLASLQHHNVPTRFIDVTSNPMTALWFATEEVPVPNSEHKTSGVLFAFDVTDTPWHRSFDHGLAPTWGSQEDPIGAALTMALADSKKNSQLFRIFPALPDERMKAQEGYFLGSTVPVQHKAPGLLGLNPGGSAPGSEKLTKLLTVQKGPGRPQTLPFCAIVIPDKVKVKLRDPLRRTYNRRRRVLFPDIDGFRDAIERGDVLD